MKQWYKESVSVEQIRKLNETYGVDYITATLLARRSVTERDAIRFVLEKDLIHLHNPFLFDEMEEFVERVLQAKSEEERVCVFGDWDADGITSTVLLVQELRSMGIETNYLLSKINEPNGLTGEALFKMRDEGVTLVITVDCGISNNDEVDLANSLGIDVLITDHHLPPDELPDAVAIINPKIKESGYPFVHLAGCGVVAKVIWALRFAQTPLFKDEFILLHAYPGNETVIVEAVKMRNLIERERVVEEIVPNTLKLHQSRMLHFLDANLPIATLDAEVVTKLLQSAFGPSVDIHIAELRGEFESILKEVTSKSLFALKQISRSVRYSQRLSELDVLISLFSAYVHKKESSLSSEYESILDLVALGTIGDLMPIVDENRILVKRGLTVIEEGRRRALLPLLTLQNLIGKKLSSIDIGWHLTPIINSSGRMDQPQVASEMLLSEDLTTSEELANKLIKLNKERQNQGEESWKTLLPSATKSSDEFDGKFVFVDNKEVSRGLTGIMASRLLRHFNSPALVVAHVEKGRVMGSIRSFDNFDVREFLSHFSDLLTDYGGHKCAGGFNMEQKNLLPLRERIKKVIATEEKKEITERVLIDAEIPPQYLTPNLIQIVELFEPYGEANPPLQFLINRAVIEQIQPIANNRGGGGGNVKLQIQHGSYRWPALYWGGLEEIVEHYQVNDEVDLIFRMDRNYYKNSESLQLTIISIKKHKTSLEKIMRVGEFELQRG